MNHPPQICSYINGEWVTPKGECLPIINPASEKIIAELPICDADDVANAVQAADRALPDYATLPLATRIDFCQEIIHNYENRFEEIANAITREMGAPYDLARKAQVMAGLEHFKAAIRAGKNFTFAQKVGNAEWIYEAIGVCALITPWNWPMNQLVAKLAPALIAGCTTILKPSEFTPLSTQIFTEIIAASHLPKGVFNVVHGNGTLTGAALVKHPQIQKVAFTGSTKTGIHIAQNAAKDIKRVTQELGGKSPNLIFADADLEKLVKIGVLHCFNNSGQSCNAPTRMLVEKSVYPKALEIAFATAKKIQLGDPEKPGKHLGPLISKQQYERVQNYIEIGIREARLICGGAGKPEGFETGYYVKPTIFADVSNRCQIAQEEIFGPVLCMMPFDNEAHAVELANDTPYGLAAFLGSGNAERIHRVARQLKAGSVNVNGSGQDYDSPFGGYKQSGNGRERGVHGLVEFLELKSINGAPN